MRLLTLAMTLFLSLGLWSCSRDVAGTATQTENTVAFGGTVYHASGSPAKGATVRMAMLYGGDKSSLQPEFAETRTDTLGRFSFEEVLADTFRLAVIDGASGEVSYLEEVLASEDSLVVRLEKATVVKGVLTYSDSALASINVGSHFTVYVVGLPLLESVFAPGEFTLLVPEGYTTLGYCPGDPAVVEKLKQSGVADSLIFMEWAMPDSVEVGDTLVTDTLVWGLPVESSSSSSSNSSSSSGSGEVVSSSSVAKSSESKAEEVVGWISGQVVCPDKESCDSVEVMVITDLFGFGFVSGGYMEFDVQTRTDSVGRWLLPVPKEVPYDSFRVEYRKVSGGVVTLAGLSRYVQHSEVADIKDTLPIGKTSLDSPSWLKTGVRLVINQEDQSQTGNCFMNSVVIGFEGTSHFIRAVTCYEQLLINIPSGNQKLLLYSGEPLVVSALQDAEAVLSEYVFTTDLVLNAGSGMDQLWLTYTPPTLK